MKSASWSAPIDAVAEPHSTGNASPRSTASWRRCSSCSAVGSVPDRYCSKQLVVELDDVLDEVFVFGPLGLDEIGGHVDGLGVPGVVHEGMMGQHVGDAVEARLLADRQFGGIGVRAEHLAHLSKGAVERRAFPVELVDEDHPGQAHVGGVAPQHLVLRLHAGDAVDHEDGEVGDRHAEERLATEVRVAGCVDQVDAVVVPVERRHGQRDRLLAGLFLRVTVERGRPLLDRPLSGDRPASTSNASARLVLPLELWPTSATFLIRSRDRMDTPFVRISLHPPVPAWQWTSDPDSPTIRDGS
jgi:hypothetical protein